MKRKVLRPKTPRAICLEILNQIEQRDQHLDKLLSDSFKRYRHLTSLDRSFLTELTYGILRWRERLDWAIRNLSDLPFEKIDRPILNILRMGLYQIQFLSKTPHASAVHESVELAKKYRGTKGGGFVNALLRSFIRKKNELHYPDLHENPPLHISILHSHPLWVVKRWIKEFGIDETVRICTFNNHIAPLVLRTNTLKIDRKELMKKLKEKGLSPLTTSISEEGILLKSPLPVSELPFLKEGYFIIQDEASQCVVSILDPKPGERILDACAAPGGKTTHIAQKMNNEGEIYALDLTRSKNKRIEQLCSLLGVRIVKTLVGDATKPLPRKLLFDRILADVPCSGFGTLRRNPDLKWKRKEEDLLRLSELQERILKNLSSYLKEGGVLVYSTCTVLQEENEEVIKRFMRTHPEFHLDPLNEFLPQAYHSVVHHGFFKTFPYKDEMDGFFVARMRKFG
ncbi:MAG: 16S rRNA (cytosine(967)-C(5))-methyltransferase RsmB [Thermodesulfobacteriota bacterium]